MKKPSSLFHLLLLLGIVVGSSYWTPVLAADECFQGMSEWKDMAAWVASKGSWKIENPLPFDSDKDTCTPTRAGDSCAGLVFNLAATKGKIFMYRGCRLDLAKFMDFIANNPSSLEARQGPSASTGDGCGIVDLGSDGRMLDCPFKSAVPKEGKRLSRECMTKFKDNSAKECKGVATDDNEDPDPTTSTTTETGGKNGKKTTKGPGSAACGIQPSLTMMMMMTIAAAAALLNGSYSFFWM